MIWALMFVVTLTIWDPSSCNKFPNTLKSYIANTRKSTVVSKVQQRFMHCYNQWICEFAVSFDQLWHFYFNLQLLLRPFISECHFNHQMGLFASKKPFNISKCSISCIIRASQTADQCFKNVLEMSSVKCCICIDKKTSSFSQELKHLPIPSWECLNWHFTLAEIFLYVHKLNTLWTTFLFAPEKQLGERMQSAFFPVLLREYIIKKTTLCLLGS